MKLISTSEISRCEIVRTFRHSPIAAIVMLLIWTGVGLFFGVALVPRAFGAGWLILILATPVALIAGLIWWLGLSAMWTAFSSCFRSSNWVMKVSDRGVYLKARSYMNHHFPEDCPTVVCLDFDEIAEARKVTICSKRDAGDTARTEIHPYLEFRLTHEETAELRALCVNEMSRKPPTGRFSSMRANHAPVIVPQAGIVRAQWLGRRMLRAFAGSVSIGKKLRIDVDSEKASPRTLDGMILDAIEAGRKIEAIQMIRQRHPEMGLAQAKAFAEGLLRELEQSAA